MKAFTCILIVVLASVAAEPPRYRSARFELQRQEVKRSEEREQTTAKEEEAPYAAAGFRPSKEFRTPSRQESGLPSTSYGIPADSYGAPLNVYSAPEREYGSPKREGKEEKGEAEEEGNERESNERFKVEGVEKGEKKEKLREGEAEGEKENEGEGRSEAHVVSQQGAYYVLLPSSQLQRVQFQTENDIRNMAYTARLQYRNEDRAPVYVYTAGVPEYQRAAYLQLY